MHCETLLRPTFKHMLMGTVFALRYLLLCYILVSVVSDNVARETLTSGVLLHECPCPLTLACITPKFEGTLEG